MTQPATQRGFSSVTAIFLVTVLAVMAAAGLQMWRSAQDDQTLDMQALRARIAARAGMQVGFWQATQRNDFYCLAAAPQVIALTLPGSLAPYRVTLSCTRQQLDDGGTAVFRRSLTATACNRPAACPDNAASLVSGYVETVSLAECVTTGVGVAAVTLCRETR